MSKNKIKTYLNSKLQIPNSKLLFFSILLFCSFLGYSLAQNEYVYDAKGKRNPFIPLVSSDGVLVKLDKEEGQGPLELKVEGIIYDKNGTSYAIAEGKVVRVGDFTGNGYQVLKIEQNKVIFIKEGEPLEVRLKEDSNAK